jgi:hypothetical protein
MIKMITMSACHRFAKALARFSAGVETSNVLLTNVFSKCLDGRLEHFLVYAYSNYIYSNYIYIV